MGNRSDSSSQAQASQRTHSSSFSFEQLNPFEVVYIVDPNETNIDTTGSAECAGSRDSGEDATIGEPTLQQIVYLLNPDDNTTATSTVGSVSVHHYASEYVNSQQLIVTDAAGDDATHDAHTEYVADVKSDQGQQFDLVETIAYSENSTDASSVVFCANGNAGAAPATIAGFGGGSVSDVGAMATTARFANAATTTITPTTCVGVNIGGGVVMTTTMASAPVVGGHVVDASSLVGGDMGDPQQQQHHDATTAILAADVSVTGAPPTSVGQATATTTQLIMLPTGLVKCENGATVVNGLSVLEVSGLDPGAESSNESGDHRVTGSASDQDPLATPPQFITVTVSPDGETVASHPGYHVQYVDQDLYAAAAQANGQAQMAYPVYTVGEAGTIYASQGGQYYATTATAGGNVAAAGGAGGNPSAATAAAVGYASAASAHYLVQQQPQQQPTVVDAETLIASQRHSPQEHLEANGYVTSTGSIVSGPPSGGGGNGAIDDIGAALGHATRVSPTTVTWLLENYETAEGVSLPRSTLYAHYIRHCGEHKLEPVNAASFGKLIRSVFLGLRTRRLGTRGNSKYHYYGIRVKLDSALVHIDEDMCSNGGGTMASNGRSSHIAAGGAAILGGQHQQQQVSTTNAGNGGCTGGGAKQNGSGVQQQRGAYKRAHDGSMVGGGCDQSSGIVVQHLSYLGDGSTAIPIFPDIEFLNHDLPDECAYDDIDTLKSIYREHLEAFLDAVMSLEFNTVESLWREFWRSLDNNNGDECEEENYLSKSKLVALCGMESVQSFVRHVDLLFYQNLIQVLVPDVLKPIPATLTQSIRNFAKSLESWLTNAMQDAPPAMLAVKLSTAAAFSSSLRRYTSLNHLAQAARAVLHNSAQITQMLADLNRVDFNSVREQASWVCQCDNEIVKTFEADFKLTLQQQNSLEQWASWLKNVVKRAMKAHEGKPTFAKGAREFLLKWSFYSSMVIRDLTLRSAASFGSFHLIRLLFDEYMFYLIEHQVAEATNIVPIAVMAEGIRENDMQQSNVYGEEAMCNGSTTIHENNAKLGCVSPSDFTSKNMKFS